MTIRNNFLLDTYQQNIVKMVLKALEFKDCALDDPEFRHNLQQHEKELERSNRDIKQLIKECTDVITASITLSRLQKQLAGNLMDFNFETLGESKTDDELAISQSLKEFGRILRDIEEERMKIFNNAMDQFIRPLEDFRRKQIGNVKAEKKVFDKESSKFYQSQEKHLSLSAKKDEGVLREADVDLQLQKRHFIQASLRYVKAIQEVHERKKFEFVETLWSFMYSWMNFFKISYDVTKEYEPYMKDLQVRVQKTRDNFNTFCTEADALMNKIKTNENVVGEENCAPISGFLYLMEKKAFATTWTKHYCTYDKSSRLLTVLPFSHTHGKATGAPDVYTLKTCFRRSNDSIDKRFCFDIAVEGNANTMTFQSLSEEDRSRWIDAMDGKEPIYEQPWKTATKEPEFATSLNDAGFRFVTTCFDAIERRGIQEQGLYRVSGVNSKAMRLLQVSLENSEKFDLSDENEWELRTLTSAVKAYFRLLPEPLMTFRLHKPLIEAAKKDSKAERVSEIHFLVHTLPEKKERKMLELLIRHLAKVAANSNRNLMTSANLGVCFGPSLLRPREESVAALVDIKFCNVVIEILIDNWQKVFGAPPMGASRLGVGVPSKPEVGQLSRSSPSSVSGSSPQERLRNKFSTLHKREAPVDVAYKHHQPVAATEEKPKNLTFLPSTRSTEHLNNSSSVYYSVPFEEPTVNGTREHNGPVVLRDHPRSSSDGRVASVVARLSAPVPYSGFNSPFNRQPLPMAVHDGPRDGRKNSDGTVTAKPLTSWSAENGSELGNSGTRSGSTSTRGSVQSLQGKPQSAGKPERATVLPVSFTSQLSPSDGASKSAIKSIASSPLQASLHDHRNSSDPCPSKRKVRTLFQCHADAPSELSFEPDEIITSVRQSIEPGWLYGELRGKTGLIPENYVEDLPDGS
ncbi:hypothetical protein RvY_12883 [Ramazzottius varieornatus]|uniref:Rho GTPase-activating protein 26 n=1 Tax=Ramazzottius varieornatus TaxID=947166 RepID=A0A1D1VTK5_RAMVA|nr:hypothetical protein RvY_12883 [Ramazzottius varieornatus]